MVFLMSAVIGFLLILSSFSVSEAVEGVKEDDSPIVQTTFGPVQGIKSISPWTNKTIYSFRGIPYASPPLGELRFKDPVLPEKWTAVKNCTQYQPLCPDLNMRMIPEKIEFFNTSEDCLFLNVYSPQIKPEGELLPVMVWIHGGTFFMGYVDYDYCGQDFLVGENVVVVTVMYRMGALGFMNLGTPGIPGNAGLKDQNFALRWVKREINRFGGDPGKVTLFGQEVGSTYVHMHYLSPLSKGLFHRAIGNSGTALNSWAARGDGPKHGLKFAKESNCNSSIMSDVEQCLRNISTDDIVMLHRFGRVGSGDWSSVFIPTVDRNSSKDPFLPELPLQLIEQKEGSMVPFLMGINRDEGSLAFVAVREENMKSKMDDIVIDIPRLVGKNISESRNKQLTRRIKEFYFGPSFTNWKGFLDMATDITYGYSTAQSARYFHHRANVYLYYFCFDGEFKEADFRLIKNNRNYSAVSHGEELNYIFVRKGVNQTAEPDSNEMRTWRRMVRMWTNFAKFGSPTIGLDPELGNISWAPVDNVTTKYLNIDVNLTMVEDNFLAKRVELWDSITP